MSSSAIVVYVVVVGYRCDVCSTQPSGFVRSANVWKNKRVAFSQRDIHILCENTHAQSAVRIIFYFYYYDFIFGG